jgi:D-lactate dehydrogenase (cytochrome)
MDERHQDCLGDESALTGQAESISFPTSEPEVQAVIARIRTQGGTITVQGGRTGLAGSAVPAGGHIMNLTGMNRLEGFERDADGRPLLRVQPGMTLAELDRITRKLDPAAGWCWPPDPSETTATVGGIVACAARGLSAHLYGPTGNHVRTARLVNAQGQVQPVTGTELDAQVGAEGMLGVLTELTLALAPRPRERWGIGFFFHQDTEAFAFAQGLDAIDAAPGPARLAAADYLDRATLGLLEAMASTPASGAPPAPPAGAAAMIYVEIHGPDEATVSQRAEALLELAGTCGVDPDATWAVADEAGVDRMRAFRHAAAEAAHQRRQPGLTWLEAHLELPGQPFPAMVQACADDLGRQGLAACLYGQILDRHLQISFLPESLALHQQASRLILDWGLAGRGLRIRERGVGKLKRQLFARATPPQELESCRRIKRLLDPGGFWNPDNLFDPTGGA